MAKKYTPMGNQVLIKVDKAPEVSEGGIIIPDDSKNKPNSGTVVTCGPDVVTLEVGDAVLFGKYVGVFLIIDGEERLQLHETDILGYYEEVTK